MTLSATGIWVEEQPANPTTCAWATTEPAAFGLWRASLRRRRGDFERWPDAGGGELLQRLDHGVHRRLRQLVQGDGARPAPRQERPSQTGTPGGEYPFWVVVKGNGSSATAYVSSIRDREIVVVNLRGAGAYPNGSPAVTARIPVKGQPNKMTLNAAQSLLYVAEDQSDTVDVIDTTTNAILETIPVIGPASLLPSSLATI